MKCMEKQNEWQNIYEFLKAIQSLKSVTRATLATEERKENSAEHSWSVAMIVWLLSYKFQEEFDQIIDIEKLIKMALMHDLIEIQIGDTSVWDKENRSKIEQQEQNKDIFLFLIASLPLSLKEELIELKDEFEEAKTLESKIVKGVDRLSAALQRVVTKQGWVNEGHNEKDLDNVQLPKIDFSEVLKSLYNQIKQESFQEDLLEK